MAFKQVICSVKALLEIETEVRKWWEDEDVFRAESRAKAPKEGEKFFSTFPFPYMNGYLHVGHAFSLSKIDFAAAYHRLRGANVLLPFGFHCTGMPIKASADKLCREIQQFGNPPVFTAEDNPALPGQIMGNKSKAATKTCGQVRQWEMMRSFGLTDSEIAKFQDPYEWLHYFPPLAVEDLKAYGLGCDWRSSFVTTDVNPFFDAFVRWQMRKLKSLGKIVKKSTYTICSPGAEHDRATGEGVRLQHYILIKMEVLHPFPPKLAPLEGKKVFLAAATLRPETLYGQTNAWVSPDGEYGAYEINETDVFVVTKRAALNLAYQNLSKIPQKLSCLVELTGFDLIGVALRSPLSAKEVIYALPMLTILPNKGTGILFSVPSDAPYDYMALHDLKTKTKPNLRIAFNVEDDWVMPIDIVPIIHIPRLGNKAAEKVCLGLKIRSQLDKEKVEDAMKLIYREGFTTGTMLTGDFVGRKVQEIRPLIKDFLIDSGLAVLYSEPETVMLSDSGDECVVSLTEQWYITYGEEEWKKMAKECLSNMNLYFEETRCRLEETCRVLNQWACSTSFGPGTQIPWDEHFLVESFSDSSLYMAYYTVAHFFHTQDMYKGSKSLILPQQMSDEVWEYLFCDGLYPQSSDISKEMLSNMKQEFEYWYPLDLRVSGKDLISNHLPLFIYNHTALMAKRNWPRGIRCNGNIMLNSEKMSNSTGNYTTLRQAIEEFSATATRFSLAAAGDGVGDVNFVFETVKATILRLTKELTWMKGAVAANLPLREGVPDAFADELFENDMNIAIRLTEKAYQDCKFKDALKNGFYGLQAARDEYRLSCSKVGMEMNHKLILRFIDVQTLLITPICPQFADHVWRKVLKKGACVLTAGWPPSKDPDLVLRISNKYLQDSIVSMKKSLLQQIVGREKPEKLVEFSVENLGLKALVYVSEQYDGWRAHSLEVLRSKFDQDKRCFPPDKEIMDELNKRLLQDNEAESLSQIRKSLMPFLSSKKKDAIALVPNALELSLPFGELDFLRSKMALIQQELEVGRIEICSATDEDDILKAGRQVHFLKQNLPLPGSPTILVFFLWRKLLDSQVR